MQSVIERGRNRVDSLSSDRFRLISLGEIVREMNPQQEMAFAGTFFGAVAHDPPSFIEPNAPLESLHREWLEKMLESAIVECQKYDLQFSQAPLVRLVEGLKSETYTNGQFYEDCRDFARRQEDEITSHLFLHLPAYQARFYQEPRRDWDSILLKFPSISFDVEEVHKCFALNRYTASVFHLMRVMEVALRLLGNTLNDPGLDPRTNPSWSRILKRGTDELAKPLAQRSPEWRSDEPFFSGAITRLTGVRDAWRNPTMHIEQTYTEETALDVRNQVLSFVRHLATKLAE